MTLRDFRRRAAAVRCIPLELVLTHWGAQRQRRDRSQWRSGCGPLSVTGAKFFNWHLQQGGGGAIDLVMHLSGWDIRAAVEWLEKQVGSASTAVPAASSSSSHTCGREASAGSLNSGAPCKSDQLRLPSANLAQLDRVRRYLTEQRGLAAHILEPLFEAGKVYADGRGNAVFLMVAGKDNHPMGAELRGTGRQIWRGLAPGTRKDSGYFWTGTAGSRQIVLCESAIDAISCFQLHRSKLESGCICISTAGVRSHPAWLQPLIAGGYDIHCAFDNDEAGEAASCRMIARHPLIKRLRPPEHDWNDALTASR